VQWLPLNFLFPVPGKRRVPVLVEFLADAAHRDRPPTIAGPLSSFTWPPGDPPFAESLAQLGVYDSFLSVSEHTPLLSFDQFATRGLSCARDSLFSSFVFIKSSVAFVPASPFGGLLMQRVHHLLLPFPTLGFHLFLPDLSYSFLWPRAHGPRPSYLGSQQGNTLDGNPPLFSPPEG